VFLGEQRHLAEDGGTKGLELLRNQGSTSFSMGKIIMMTIRGMVPASWTFYEQNAWLWDRGMFGKKKTRIP
jgi:hypothetical protein